MAQEKTLLFACASALLFSGWAGPALAADAVGDGAAAGSGPESPADTSNAPAPGAAPATETGGVGLEEVIVTARKVAENQQSVPVAITAITGEGLEQRNAVRVTDLARIAPGLTFNPGSSNASGFNVQLRGQFQRDVLATVDPSVGTYVDGLYWARAYGLNADFLDVESTQVLRGPQGTLFGRNTTGGAILIQTNDPDPDHFTGLVSAGVGRFDERSATVVLNLPLVEDRVALRVAANILDRDGYVSSVPFDFNGTSTPSAAVINTPFAGDNLSTRYPGSTGREIGGRDNYTVRAKLLVRPTENLSLVFSGEQFEFSSFAQNYRLAYVDPTSAANFEAGLELGASPADPAAAFALGRDFFASYIPFTQSSDNVSLNEDPSSYAKTQTFTTTATLDTSFGAVKFIGGYRRVESEANIDLDGSPIYLFGTYSQQELEQYSGELQISGTAFDGAVDFAGGIYLFEESGTDGSQTISFPVVATLAPGSQLTRNLFVGDIETESQGIYGQATWHLSDQLSFTGGLRYSVDEKGVTVFNRAVSASTNATVACSIAGSDINSTPLPCRRERSDEFDSVSYTAGVNYELNDDTLVYLKTGRGFRSGGQNLRASGAANAAFVPFDAEIVHEHEAGLKTELFDNRLRLNLAAFYNEVDNIQRTTLVTFTNPVTGTTGTATITANAGEVRNYGLEAELTARVTEGFTLSSAIAYQKPEYLEFVGVTSTGAPIDRSGERFEQVPEWTASVNANYEHEFDSGRLVLNANYAWQDETALSPFNSYTDANGVLRDVSGGLPISQALSDANLASATQEAGGQLNLRAAVSFLNDSLEIAAWGRNVNNFRPNVISLFLTPPTSVLATQRRDPAMYGVSLTYRFGQ